MFRLLFLLVLFSAGSCELPPQCSNGLRDGDESDVDCGGSCSLHCADGLRCGSKLDCVTGVCSFGVCQAASCTDGIRNGTETDLDCGGGCMQRCDEGLQCLVNSDCESDSCDVGLCTATPGLSVKRGSVAGGTQLTITLDAQNTSPVKTIRFGDAEATALTSSTTKPVVLTVTTPPSPFARLGEVPVSIEFDDGRVQTLKGKFRYYLTKLKLKEATALEIEETTCRELAVGDINNDSNLDIVVSCYDYILQAHSGYIYYGNGDGTFRKMQLSIVSDQMSQRIESGQQILLADVDGDGRLDIVPNNWFEELRVAFQEKDGTFRLKQLPINKKIYRIRIADLNQDGLLDFVLLHNLGTGEITLVFNRGGRNLNPWTKSTLRAGAYYSYDAAFADFTLNGSLDIALPSRSIDTTVVLQKNNRSGSFPLSAKFPTVNHNVTIAAVDMNQDGFIDLIGSSTGSIHYVQGRENTQFLNGVALNMGKMFNYTLWDISTGDLDADGFSDAIFSGGGSKTSSEVSILLSKKVRTPAELTVRYEATCGDGATAVGDFNNDGKPDLVVACNEANQPPAQVLLNDSTE